MSEGFAVKRSSTDRVPLETLVTARALGISLVVANHAGLTPASVDAGGLNVLLLVSGLSIARFAFSGTTRETVRTFRTIAAGIAIPSLIVAGLTALALRRLSVLELLLVSNWFTTSRVALFPIWYTQMLIQVMIGLAVLFWALDLTGRIRRDPILTIGLLFAASTVLAAFGTARLPQLHLWNFVAGWLVWAVAVRRPAGNLDKALLTGIILVVSWAVFFWVEMANAWSRSLWMGAAVVALIWWPTIRLSARIRHLTVLVSHASLYIFLLHPYIFSINKDWIGRLDIRVRLLISVINFVAAIVLPVCLWALVSAARRTWQQQAEQSRKLRQPA